MSIKKSMADNKSESDREDSVSELKEDNLWIVKPS
jgi:hypothetical protein